MSDTPRWALRFISGKYQGGEFPVFVEREIIIGRSSDIDMVLVEDMVSRRHAKVTTSLDEIYIQDLGSTNGTFVNGEKVARSQLREGDRILVGTSIIKLVNPSQDTTEEQAKEAMRIGGQRQPTSGRPMSGSIEEIPLPDLLQLLSTSRKSGVLAIMSRHGTGKIYLRSGQIYFSAIDDDFQILPQKAIFRMLRWRAGEFELQGAEEIQVMNEITDSTEGLLMDGVRQIDEYRRIETKLPRMADTLAVATPLPGSLSDLSPIQLDAFQQILSHGTLQKVLDSVQTTDYESAQAVLDLIDKKMITVGNSGGNTTISR